MFFCDLKGTDHLRWMGDTRFTYGVIKKSSSRFFASSPFADASLLCPHSFSSSPSAMELSTWQGTVYLKLDPSTNPPSKAVFARHLQRSVDSSSRLSGSPSPSPPTSRPELEGDGPLPDLPEDEGATPWLDEETRDQWVRFESGGKKGAGANGSGKKEDLLYVYTGTVGMMSRCVSVSLRMRSREVGKGKERKESGNARTDVIFPSLVSFCSQRLPSLPIHCSRRRVHGCGGPRDGVSALPAFPLHKTRRVESS